MPHLLALLDPQASQLLSVLVQLAVILAASMLFVALARRLGQPAVVGQIFAGLALGPSLLGRLETLANYPAHPLSAAIFNPATAGTFSILSQLGLILLMFLVGLEFQLQHIKSVLRPAALIVALGVGAPLALGLAAGYALWPTIQQNQNSPHELAAATPHGFALFLGTALAITALPVLARILTELGILRTRLGTITMAAAALGDALGWILLAAVSAFVQARYHVSQTLSMLALLALFVALVFAAVRPAARWACHKFATHPNLLPLLLLALFLATITTHLIGISPIFGAFLLGVALSDQPTLRDQVRTRLEAFVHTLFLPIFFTYAGLRTDISTFATPTLWLVAALLLGIAIVGKLGACTLAARATGLPWRDSACVGALMNTRGLMELVVANLGYDLGVIPRSVYSMLVLMALLTTLMTTPLVLWLKRGTELDEPVTQWATSRRRPRCDAPRRTNPNQTQPPKHTFREINNHE